MKMFLALILMVSVVKVVHTEQIRDMNADGQVGIEEADLNHFSE